MEQVLSQDFNILQNPFTSKNAVARLILWSENALKENEDIIPSHQFYIFSKKQKSKKLIAWVPMDKRFEWKQLFEKTGWENFYLWTTGSASLEDTKDMKVGVNMIITWDEGCSLPSLPVIFPLLEKLSNEIEKSVEEYLNRSDFNVYFQFESFSSYAFKKVVKPQLIRKDE